MCIYQVNNCAGQDQEYIDLLFQPIAFLEGLVNSFAQPTGRTKTKKSDNVEWNDLSKMSKHGAEMKSAIYNGDRKHYNPYNRLSTFETVILDIDITLQRTFCRRPFFSTYKVAPTDLDTEMKGLSRDFPVNLRRASPCALFRDRSQYRSQERTLKCTNTLTTAIDLDSRLIYKYLLAVPPSR